MDQELFSKRFSKQFLKHAVPTRPLLLLLDGHSSHYTLQLIKSAEKQKVVIFCLPSITTADSQPLDPSYFKLLKSNWVDVCRKHLFAHPSRMITKFQFSLLFSEAWCKSMTIDNILSGFRATGVYLFNPNVILDELPKPKGTEQTRITASNVEFTADMIKRFEIQHLHRSDPCAVVNTSS